MYVPTVLELRVSTDVPVPPAVSVTLVGLREAVRPEGEATIESATGPAKPVRLARDTVEVLGTPVITFRLVGLEMLKSETLTVIVVECERDPLVASTVTVYVPLVV